MIKQLSLFPSSPTTQPLYEWPKGRRVQTTLGPGTVIGEGTYLVGISLDALRGATVVFEGHRLKASDDDDTEDPDQMEFDDLDEDDEEELDEEDEDDPWDEDDDEDEADEALEDDVLYGDITEWDDADDDADEEDEDDE